MSSGGGCSKQNKNFQQLLSSHNTKEQTCSSPKTIVTYRERTRHPPFRSACGVPPLPPLEPSSISSSPRRGKEYVERVVGGAVKQHLYPIHPVKKYTNTQCSAQFHQNHKRHKFVWYSKTHDSWWRKVSSPCQFSTPGEPRGLWPPFPLSWGRHLNTNSWFLLWFSVEKRNYNPSEACGRGLEYLSPDCTSKIFCGVLFTDK